MSNIDNPPAGLIKRLSAIVYDSLLALAMAMGLILLPASILITFAHLDPQSSAYVVGILIWAYLVMLIYFGWFWTHGGQTLGMRSWRLRLVDGDGKIIGWKAAWIRFTLGLPAWTLLVVGIYSHKHLTIAGPVMLVVGLIWVLYEQSPNSLRDRLSGTRVIALPKPVRPPKPPKPSKAKAEKPPKE